MAKPLVVANWKMKLAPRAAAELAAKTAKAVRKYEGAQVVLCPGFMELAAVREAIQKSAVKLGAQDCFWEEAGAFTGAVSPRNLKEYGVEYVIVGHSERREYLGETDEMVHKKIKLLLSLGLRPILCIGESFSERQEGRKEVVLIRELHAALDGLWLNGLNELIVAYEPIWVIGSGQAVSAEEAQHTHQVIRQTLYDIWPRAAVDSQVSIIYGGSVDPENVGSFLAQSAVAGVLVGTASLSATALAAIAAAAAKSS